MKMKIATWVVAPVAIACVSWMFFPTSKNPVADTAPPSLVPAPVAQALTPSHIAPAPPVASAAEDIAPTGMSKVVWHRAQQARDCAIRRGQISPSSNMAIIDYDMPSSKKRLWIVDPIKHHTLVSDWVAHGSGSGELMAKQFSNKEGSFQTSLGVFRVGEVYEGQHGASLRLDGLERGFNDHARSRAIVMHSAWYVDPQVVDRTGRLGRSQGCPAVRGEVIGKVQRALADGGMLFAHASQDKWVDQSAYLNCA